MYGKGELMAKNEQTLAKIKQLKPGFELWNLLEQCDQPNADIERRSTTI